MGPTLVVVDDDDSLVVFPNPMLTLKDRDLMLNYGFNQCQVHKEDDFLPSPVLWIPHSRTKLSSNAFSIPFGVK